MSQPPAIAYLKFLKRLGYTHLPSTSAAQSPSAASSAAPASEPAPDVAQLSPPAPGVEQTPPAATIREPEPVLKPPASDAPSLFTETEMDLVTKGDLFVPPELSAEERAARLKAREEALQTCEECKLCPGRNEAANRLVYGVGNAHADLVFVGEGPGEQEDVQGEPFVGKGGQLLTKMIDAMGLARSDVYICNVVKHRPPGNRDPEPDEIAACEPYLIEQLDLIQPKVLVTLGNCATKTLLRTKTGITRLRGTWQTYHGIPTMPTYHPAYVLRQYTKKNRADVWGDLQEVLKRLK